MEVNHGKKTVKLDIYGGLLGAGKTTLIRRMLSTAYQGYKTAIIENEIGKINLDEEVLQDPSIEVKPLTSGCICCTMKGSFTEAVELLITEHHPDYIVIEPSGMADFAVVADACTKVEAVKLNRAILVVHGKKLMKLMRIAGTFLRNQITTAQTVFLNMCEEMDAGLLEATKNELWELNPDIHIIAVPMTEVDGTVLPDGLNNLNNKKKRMLTRGGRGKEIQSWSYTFLRPITDEMKVRLDELFCSVENEGLWRGKGYLNTAGGKIMKVDYVYGDAFIQFVDSVAEGKKNILVMIGQTQMKEKSMKICREIDSM